MNDPGSGKPRQLQLAELLPKKVETETRPPAYFGLVQMVLAGRKADLRARGRRQMHGRSLWHPGKANLVVHSELAWDVISRGTTSLRGLCHRSIQPFQGRPTGKTLDPG